MKKIFSKITSQFNQVTKRIFIVLFLISVISVSIWLMLMISKINEQGYTYRINDFIVISIFFCVPLIGYWILVAVVNWIKKVATK
jgi:hypothetical protein